jgi:arylsulfatase A
MSTKTPFFCLESFRRHLLTALLLAPLAALHAAETKPNIVLILADDLGWKDIGCYGGPVKTLALDALAAGGTRFTDFYSGCAVCSPSRAVLLTGRHHIRAGVYSWISDAGQRSHLLEREVTLPEILKQHGYATAHVGKWHLGLPTRKHDKPTPDKHGFDHWFATWNNAEPSHRNPETFIRNGKPMGKLEGYSCQLVVDEAITWLDQHRAKDKPFFLNVWFHEPHAPIAAPDEIVGSYGKLKDQAAIYSGTIDNTDRAIARLLAKLKETAPIGETLIIYASDNGSYRKDRVGELRGQKGLNWEGGIRVPGIFHWPGVISAGRVEKTPAGLVDVLPTVCGLLGIAAPEGVHLDGSDLTPLLNPKAGRAFTRHQPLFWHLQKSRPIVAMRDGPWSLTADPDYELSTDNMFREEWIPVIKAGGYKNWQLHNLDDDSSQTTDLATRHPDVLERMKSQLLKINASIMADGTDWHLPSPR